MGEKIRHNEEHHCLAEDA